ncbi:MAG: hypothetical protein ACYDBH_20355 [Acidobacteriaceae bacterium]
MTKPMTAREALTKAAEICEKTAAEPSSLWAEPQCWAHAAECCKFAIGVFRDSLPEDQPAPTSAEREGMVMVPKVPSPEMFAAIETYYAKWQRINGIHDDQKLKGDAWGAYHAYLAAIDAAVQSPDRAPGDEAQREEWNAPAAQEHPTVNSASRQNPSESIDPGTVGRSDIRQEKTETVPVRASVLQLVSAAAPDEHKNAAGRLDHPSVEGANHARNGDEGGKSSDVPAAPFEELSEEEVERCRKTMDHGYSPAGFDILCDMGLRTKRAEAELAALRAEIREWACADCNYVYPGPPQKGFACVMCPRCGGTTAPKGTVLLRRAEAEIARLKSEVAARDALLLEVSLSGIVHNDYRLGYLEVQIDRKAWEELRALRVHTEKKEGE